MSDRAIVLNTAIIGLIIVAIISVLSIVGYNVSHENNVKDRVNYEKCISRYNPDQCYNIIRTGSN